MFATYKFTLGTRTPPASFDAVTTYFDTNITYNIDAHIVPFNYGRIHYRNLGPLPLIRCTFDDIRINDKWTSYGISDNPVHT